MNRRSFLKVVATALSATFGWVGCLFQRRFEFKPTERETIAAAAARLIPSDDSPGAKEAGVIDYIERALDTRYHRVLREPFRLGAAVLEALAQKSWQKPFAAIEATDQDSVLSYVEAGKADTPEFPASRFFQRLFMLTIEGWLGDPLHGGNRNEVGWKFIGYKPGEPRPGACQKDCGH